MACTVWLDLVAVCVCVVGVFDVLFVVVDCACVGLICVVCVVFVLFV